MRRASARRIAAVLLGLAATMLSPGSAVAYPTPPEPYAGYQPQTHCRAQPRPGTVAVAAWIERRFEGGAALASIRRCRDGGVSEHKDGRAIDWSMDARRGADRAEVRRFLERLLATDADGEPHALARRMGVMYVIWNDRMWASYRDFAPTDYRPCPTRRTCSPTLRHRDHVHLSLGRPGARAETSWFSRGPA